MTGPTQGHRSTVSASQPPVSSLGLIGTIGILTGKGPPCDLLQGWLRQLPETVEIEMLKGNQIAWQRNEIIRHRTGDWVLFLDNDSVPQYKALEKLLAHNLPIVSGTILERVVPFDVCAVKNIEPYERYRPEDLPSSVFPVPAVGTGCLLIREQVFQEMRDPWFRCGQVHPELIAEDFDFSLRAAEAGFPLYLDPGVQVGHDLGGVILWPAPDGVAVQWPTRTGQTPYRERLGPVGRQ